MHLLASLRIDACAITDAAAAALASSSSGGRSAPRLARIAIGGNLVSASGLRALVGAFVPCTTLCTLNVSCTPQSGVPVLAPVDTELLDTLASLDSRRAAGAPAAQAAGQPLRRSSTARSNVSAAAASALASQGVGGSMHSAAGGADGGMLVWSEEMVAALAPLLKRIDTLKVRARSCHEHSA